MHDIRFATAPGAAITIDHRNGRRSVGSPVTAYRRVERSTDRPNYAARRLGAVGALLAALLLAAQVLGVAATFFGSNTVLAQGVSTGGAPAASSDVAHSSGSHVARDGDSLWSIADQHRGEVDRESYIDVLVELNGDPSIRAGQAVLLP